MQRLILNPPVSKKSVCIKPMTTFGPKVRRYDRRADRLEDGGVQLLQSGKRGKPLG